MSQLTHHTISDPLVVIVVLQSANLARQFRQIEEFIQTRFRYDNRLQIKIIIESYSPSSGMCEKCCIKILMP